MKETKKTLQDEIVCCIALNALATLLIAIKEKFPKAEAGLHELHEFLVGSHIYKERIIHLWEEIKFPEDEVPIFESDECTSAMGLAGSAVEEAIQLLIKDIED